MRRALLASALAVMMAVAATAASVSGSWSTNLTLTSQDVLSTTSLALTAELASWEITSTSVLSPQGWEGQTLTLQRELGAVALSGGLALAAPSGVTTGSFNPEDGFRWEGSGLELTGWDLSVELTLGQFRLGVTIMRGVDNR